MKGITKGIIIFSVICFFLGITLCIIGAISGAEFKDFFNDIKFDDYTRLESNFSQIYTGVENIDLDIDYGNVDIICSDEFKVEIASNNSYNKYSCTLDNGTLKIKSKSKKGFNLGNSNMSFVIYVPYETEFGKFDANIGACNFNAEKINAKDVKLEVGAGNIEVSNLTAYKCSADCGVGNLSFDAADIKEKLNVDCGVGEVSIELFGTKNDFSYDVDCSLGEVNIDNSSYGAIGSEIKHNNSADKDIKINCSLGQVNISFINE